MGVGPRNPQLTQPAFRHLSTQNSLGSWVPQSRDLAGPQAGPSSSRSANETGTKFNPIATWISQRDSQGSPGTHLCRHTHPCLLGWELSRPTIATHLHTHACAFTHFHGSKQHTPPHTAVTQSRPWWHTACTMGHPNVERDADAIHPYGQSLSRAHTHRCPRTLLRNRHTHTHRVTLIHPRGSPSSTHPLFLRSP